jgi:hypothetical protein
MAQGDLVAYNDVKEQLFKKLHDFVNDTIKVTAHTGYTPDIDAHQVWADTGVSSTEYSTASGYTAGGKTLASKSVTQDNTNDRALFDAADVTWTALGPLSPATPSHIIIWNDTPTSPADPLICYGVWGTTATNGGDITWAWSSSPSAILSIT